MQIQWNKVTWYSKALALALFIVVPCWAFWWGMQYGALTATLNNAAVGQNTTTTVGTTAVSPYYQNVAEWQTDQDSAGGFTIAYPIDFKIDDNYLGMETASAGWAYDPELSDTIGVEDLTITIPSIFEPQTNFADATLAVGRSSEAAAVKNCLQAPQNNWPETTSTAVINGISFFKLSFSGVGAGNIYDTTGYYTVHAGQCYAIEYTIHSSQIGNYPLSYNLQPFNATILTDVLDRIVGTFRFQ